MIAEMAEDDRAIAGDEGEVLPVANARTSLKTTVERRITELVRKAAG